MALLGAFSTVIPGQVIPSAVWNTNFTTIRDWANASVVLTDASKTITVTHTYAASQTFTQGWTAGAASTISAGGLTIGAGGLTVSAGVTALQALTATTATFSSTVVASNGLTVGAIVSAAGTPLTLGASAGNVVQVQSNATNTMYWDTAGNLLANNADAVDLGDSTTHRFRAGYFGATVVTGLLTGGGTVRLKPGVSDHCYVEWYARTASPSARSAFLGYGSVGSTQLSVWNELNGAIAFGTNATARWTLTASGHWVASTDNVYDLGQPGANRPRNIYASGSVVIAAQATIGGALTAGATVLGTLSCTTLTVTSGSPSFPSLTLTGGLTCTTISATTISGTTATLTGIAGAPRFTAGYSATANRVTINSNGTQHNVDPQIPHHVFVNGGSTYTFDINQLVTPPGDCLFAITIKAHAAAQFGTIQFPGTWSLAGAFASPAVGKNRTYLFQWSAGDSRVYEVSRSAADVSN